MSNLKLVGWVVSRDKGKTSHTCFFDHKFQANIKRITPCCLKNQHASFQQWSAGFLMAVFQLVRYPKMHFAEETESLHFWRHTTRWT